MLQMVVDKPLQDNIAAPEISNTSDTEPHAPVTCFIWIDSSILKLFSKLNVEPFSPQSTVVIFKTSKNLWVFENFLHSLFGFLQVVSVYSLSLKVIENFQATAKNPAA